MVEKLKEQNWTFTFIWADHDLEKMASKISINNAISFDKELLDKFII